MATTEGLSTLLHAGAAQPALAAHLDSLLAAERIAQARGLSGRELGELFSRCAGAPPLTLSDLVPDEATPAQMAIYCGMNSLPAFRVFEKRFFRAAGWHVACGPVAGAADLESIVSREWFGVVGFSIAADRHLENLRNAIAAVRAKSVNRNVGIIVGGPAFFEKPELAIEVGADGTAINAPAAVMLAKKLLVPSLVTGGTAGR